MKKLFCALLLLTNISYGYEEPTVKRVSKAIGFKMSKAELDKVFKHPSRHPTRATEFSRLETLGDATLRESMEFIVRKSSSRFTVDQLVSNAHLAERFQALGLLKYCDYDHNDDVNAVCADTMEVIIGVIADKEGRRGTYINFIRNHLYK